MKNVVLEETVLVMLNRELMVRGNAAKESQSLIAFQKSYLAKLERRIAEGQNQRNFPGFLPLAVHVHE